MNRLAKEFGPKGLVIVAPSLDAEAQVLQFRKSTKAEYPMLSDGRELARRYMVQSFPFMYLVGKDSKILWKGNWRNAEMLKVLEAALAEEGPAGKGPAGKAPASVYVLKDGRRIPVASKMEADGKIILRDEQGKMTTIAPDDVQDVLTGDQAADAAAKATLPESSGKTDPPPPEPKAGNDAKAAEPVREPSKYPVLVLRDGRRIVAVMKMEAGKEIMVKDESGQMQTISKSDIVETIPAGR